MKRILIIIYIALIAIITTFDLLFDTAIPLTLQDFTYSLLIGIMSATVITLLVLIGYYLVKKLL